MAKRAFDACDVSVLSSQDKFNGVVKEEDDEEDDDDGEARRRRQRKQQCCERWIDKDECSLAFRAIVSSRCELGLESSLCDDDAGNNNNDDDDGNNNNNDDGMKRFFEEAWQKQPALYRGSEKVRCDNNDNNNSSSSSDESDEDAWKRVLGMGWDDIADLLQFGRRDDSAERDNQDQDSQDQEQDQQQDSQDCQDSQDLEPALFFQNGRAISDPALLYSCCPFSAFLDGCSVILNHADGRHPAIAGLCDDLQQTFPHVYANAYLTPPSGFAVRPHADDRDVIVLQLAGTKRWKVHRALPVQLPFAHEQFGKTTPRPGDDDDDDDDWLLHNGGLCFGGEEVVLSRGDALYLPRGFVHQATTVGCRSEPSFHVTIALATHDWCLSVLLSEAVRAVLNKGARFRPALPIGPPAYQHHLASSPSLLLKQQFDAAMERIQRELTSSAIEQNLRLKYALHNQKAHQIRTAMMHRYPLQQPNNDDNNAVVVVVGFHAASRLSLRSTVRASTPNERNSVHLNSGRLRGLTVREETAPLLTSIITKFKKDPHLKLEVVNLRRLLITTENMPQTTNDNLDKLDLICDFTLLCFARCCVELGALALVTTTA